MKMILLVSNNLVFTLKWQLVLRLYGFKVNSVTDLFQARIALQLDRYGLVLTDARIDDGSGHDYCSLLRREAKAAALVLLGHESDGEKIFRGKLTGVSDFRLKSSSVQAILAVIRRNLYQSRVSSRVSLANIPKACSKLTIICGLWILTSLKNRPQDNRWVIPHQVENSLVR